MEKDCCKKTKKGYEGIIYGLMPHIGCILFIIFAIIGATTAISFLKPLLINKSFFYILIALSIIFATISAFFYLKKHNSISRQGIKEHKKYLSILYGTSILVNLLFFFVIFPYATNAIAQPKMTGNAILSTQTITLQVNIPCSGHAPLIKQELYQLDGIKTINYKLPNLFEITYDLNKITKQQILNLQIFKEFPATEKI